MLGTGWTKNGYKRKQKIRLVSQSKKFKKHEGSSEFLLPFITFFGRPAVSCVKG
jgi:hypothetical protein